MISQSGAYSRLVSPAPCSDSGRNRFHRPCACALRFSSSTMRVGTQALPARRLAAISSWKRASFG